MLKKIYNRCLKLASNKNSKFFLSIVSFVESSFFPIPPDVMIAPMVIANKKDYLKIFLLHQFSVLGNFWLLNWLFL